MVHESLPTTTTTLFGSHPRRVFSISYLLTGFFHGGNTGSNPVGDANIFWPNISPRSSFQIKSPDRRSPLNVWADTLRVPSGSTRPGKPLKIIPR
jgi:hypothetical protein